MLHHGSSARKRETIWSALAERSGDSALQKCEGRACRPKTPGERPRSVLIGYNRIHGKVS
jgi:hypothetical protein